MSIVTLDKVFDKWLKDNISMKKIATAKFYFYFCFLTLAGGNLLTAQ